jgi:hypothetical protein
MLQFGWVVLGHSDTNHHNRHRCGGADIISFPTTSAKNVLLRNEVDKISDGDDGRPKCGVPTPASRVAACLMTEKGILAMDKLGTFERSRELGNSHKTPKSLRIVSLLNKYHFYEQLAPCSPCTIIVTRPSCLSSLSQRRPQT